MWSVNAQTGVLIHELTHAYNDTADHFYYLNGMGNQPYNSSDRNPDVAGERGQLPDVHTELLHALSQSAGSPGSSAQVARSGMENPRLPRSRVNQLTSSQSASSGRSAPHRLRGGHEHSLRQTLIAHRGQ